MQPVRDLHVRGDVWGGERGKKYIKMTLKRWWSRVALSQSGAEVPQLIRATHTSVLIPLLTVSAAWLARDQYKQTTVSLW